MLAWVPPHSAPQFTTYAVLSSLLKKAQTGWSKPGTKVTTGFAVPTLDGVITAIALATESEPWLKARTRFPVLPMERKWQGRLKPWSPWSFVTQTGGGGGSGGLGLTGGQLISAVLVPVLRLMTAMTPRDCPITGAVGTAIYAAEPSGETTKLSVTPGKVT